MTPCPSCGATKASLWSYCPNCGAAGGWSGDADTPATPPTYPVAPQTPGASGDAPAGDPGAFPFGGPGAFGSGGAGAFGSGGAGASAAGPYGPPPVDTPWAVQPVEGTERRPGGRVRLVAAVAGVLAVAMIGGLAYMGFAGDGRGADTPEDAVRDLASAISNEDVVAGLRAVDPEEVDPYLEQTKQLSKAATGKEDGAKPDKVRKFMDLNVSGLELRTEQLSGDVARVDLVRGTVSARVNPLQLSRAVTGARVDRFDTGGNTDENSDKAREESGKTTFEEMRKQLPEQFGGKPAFVMAVKRDDRWYVSALYTIAEYARIAAELPAPDWKRVDRKGDGGATPSEAATTLLKATAQADANKLISAMPNERLQVLYDYRATLMAALGDKYADFQKAWSGALDLTSTKTREEKLSDGKVKVVFEDVSANVNFMYDRDGKKNGFEGTAWIRGACMGAKGTATKTETEEVIKNESSAYPWKTVDGNIVRDANGEYTKYGQRFESTYSYRYRSYDDPGSSGNGAAPKLPVVFDGNLKPVRTDGGNAIYSDTPLPWVDSQNNVAVTLFGQETTPLNQGVGDVRDANGRVVWSGGYPVGAQPKYGTVNREVTKQVDDENCISATDREKTGVGEVFVVAVKEKDGWYVSPQDTLAEYARLATNARLN